MSGWWSSSPVRRYGEALVWLAAALGLRTALEPWLLGRFPFAAVLAAVGAAAWRLGPGPAGLVAVLGFAAIFSGRLIEPPVQPWFGGPPAWVATGYLLSSAVLVLLGGALQRLRAARKAVLDERRHSQAALQRSESLLRSLFESTRLAMGIVELTDDGDILHLQDNARTCRVFGVPPGGTDNRLSSELGSPPEIIALWRRHYLESQARGQPVDFAYADQRPDGQRWLVGTVGPLPAVPGEPQRFSYVFDDATDRHSAEQRQRQSAAHARLALDVAEIGTWSWDPTQDTLRADRRCRALCGLPHTSLLHLRDLIERVHPEDRAAFEGDLQIARLPRSSGTYSREVRVMHPDGSLRWMVSRGQMLLPDGLDGDAGPKALLLNTVLDITARKLSEQAMADSDRRKNEFIATLSHELRNPLAPLRNGVTMLRRAGDDPALRTRVIETMERQLGHMVRMIDDLLDVSRITRDQLTLRRQPLVLSQVVTAAIETAQPLIDARGHTLALQLPGRGAMVQGDAARLTQVLTNLLNNAAKYTPSGGQIGLTLEADAQEARLCVTDNGIGIPADQLPRVFDMFSQLDRETPLAQGGLGIGLAISRRLMEMHGGRLEAHSDGPGHGSRFTMVLPCMRDASPVTVSGASAGHHSTARPRRILVVDDNIDAAQTLCELLSLNGHQTRAVHDGPTALRLATEWPPDVALLDIGMPQMDGYELARRLLDQAGPAAPMLLAVTGWGQQADRQRSAAAGFDDHLVKPVDPQALMQLIDSLPLHDDVQT